MDFILYGGWGPAGCNFDKVFIINFLNYYKYNSLHCKKESLLCHSHIHSSNLIKDFKPHIIICPPLRLGERGLGVALLQAALIDLGYPMPITTSGKGFPDGNYGQETRSTVLKFQEKSKIDRDGLAGKQTIDKLDKLLMSLLPGSKPLIGKSLSSLFSAHDYKIGTDDPIVTPDPGAGPWNSKPKTMSAKVQRAAILDAIPASIVLIG